MKTYTQEELKEILELHKKWLNDEKDGVRANLVNAYLRNADLRYADLYNADLHNANLINADLGHTRLSYANLDSANLNSANLVNANLRNANLVNTDLRNANLHNADLVNANLFNTNLRYAIGEMKYIKSLQCEKYYISYTYKTLNIGCQTHLIEDWKNFTNEQISKMDIGALHWWNKWKPILMNIIKVSPCETHKDEE